jgi:hypothetical protein
MAISRYVFWAKDIFRMKYKSLQLKDTVAMLGISPALKVDMTKTINDIIGIVNKGRSADGQSTKNTTRLKENRRVEENT